MKEIAPLYLYVTDEVSCVDNHKDVPLMASSQIIQMSKERVQFYLDNKEKLKEDFKDIIIMLKIKYNRKILHVVDPYDLPDVNGSECMIDD